MAVAPPGLPSGKTSKLLESSLAVAGLNQDEIEANDLENVLLAETKDHADWPLLQQMAQQAGQAGASGRDGRKGGKHRYRR